MKPSASPVGSVELKAYADVVWFESVCPRDLLKVVGGADPESWLDFLDDQRSLQTAFEGSS